MKKLVKSSGIYSSLTPRGRPRRSADGLTGLQAESQFPEKIQGTGKKRNITRSCVVCFPAQKMDFSKNRRKKEEDRKGVQPPVQCLQSCPLYSRLFSARILFRTMLLPIFEDTMQIMIMMMEIVIN